MATDLASDPVSSLRAAALSTLKSKRRKPAIDRSVPISERPQPPKDVFQLDYGQEESSSDVPMADATTSTQAPSPVQPKQDDLEAPPGRDISLEEGEISDDEPVVTPLRSARKQPTPPRKVFSSPRPISPEPRVLAEARQLVRSSSTRSSSSPEAGPSRQSSNHVKTSSEHPTARIPTHSPQFVRPNVNLTQNEYDAVKDVVLDLLGWGVPPIHFVECGVSREALFYVFSELNLALPDGFDSSGLVPFTPEDYTKSKSQQPIIMPPPPIPEKEKRPILEILTPNSTSPLETPNTDISMTLVESPLTSLNDIERQRRLELRARKAAQATRKLQYSTSTESGSGASSDSQAPPLIVSPDVDDFLSSLGPQLVMAPSSIEHFSTEAKECKTNDEPNSPQSNLPDYSPSSQEASLSVQEPPPASADSVVTFESTSMSVTSDSAILPESPAEFEPPLPHPVSAPIPSINYPTTRRGVKRAVATDFDFDQPAPRRNGSTPQPAKQAKTAFVSIGSRRCVIDLSDSEDDDESPPRYQPLPVVLDQQPWHKRDRRTKASTYPSPVSSKPMTPVGGAVSPSVLLQKELEIRRMRELIAQREEETRLKKLAAKSITSAISSAPVDEPMVVIAQPQPIRLKTEEPDIEMSSPTPIELTDDADAKRVRAEIIARRSSESASPPAEISEASLPITRSVTVSPISPSQDFTPDSPDSVAEVQKLQVKIEPFSSVEISKDSKFLKVDVDMIPSSSSAQMNKNPTVPSPLQKQDGRKSPQPVPQESSSSEPPRNQPPPVLEMSRFNSYSSPFASYPLLRDHTSTPYDHLRPSPGSPATLYSPSVHTTYTRFSTNDTSSRVSSFIPDLRPLRLLSYSKHLDTSKRLCQYEIPGGGTCRDDNCEDVHLSKLGSDGPSDRETADYLFSLLPAEWRTAYDVFSSTPILDALQHAQHQAGNAPLDLQGRVTDALTILMTTPSA